MSDRAPIPRDPQNDYTPAMAEQRAQFLRERTGVTLDHVRKASFDPAALPGNIENFIGVAQVPIGLAGPLLINGEHARGERDRSGGGERIPPRDDHRFSAHAVASREDAAMVLVRHAGEVQIDPRGTDREGDDRLLREVMAAEVDDAARFDLFEIKPDHGLRTPMN